MPLFSQGCVFMVVKINVADYLQRCFFYRNHSTRERCFNQKSSADKPSVWRLKLGFDPGWISSQPEFFHSVIFLVKCVNPEVNKLASPVSENLVLFSWNSQILKCSFVLNPRWVLLWSNSAEITVGTQKKVRRRDVLLPNLKFIRIAMIQI